MSEYLVIMLTILFSELPIGLWSIFKVRDIKPHSVVKTNEYDIISLNIQSSGAQVHLGWFVDVINMKMRGNGSLSMFTKANEFWWTIDKWLNL